jgi:hypothetical protein
MYSYRGYPLGHKRVVSLEHVAFQQLERQKKMSTHFLLTGNPVSHTTLVLSSGTEVFLAVGQNTGSAGMHPIAMCRLWFAKELMAPKAESGARPIALDAGALQVVELWLLIGYRTRSYCCVKEFTSNTCDREPWRPLTWMLDPEFVKELLALA